MFPCVIVLVIRLIRIMGKLEKEKRMASVELGGPGNKGE